MLRSFPSAKFILVSYSQKKLWIVFWQFDAVYNSFEFQWYDFFYSHFFKVVELSLVDFNNSFICGAYKNVSVERSLYACYPIVAVYLNSFVRLFLGFSPQWNFSCLATCCKVMFVQWYNTFYRSFLLVENQLFPLVQIC